MDYFYDGQVRRYITQFMRVFIGFKYKTNDGTLKEVPVSYGDMSRQVAAIIKDNSENKMPTVPKIACYISNLEMDTSRLADATFVSKVNIRERHWNSVDGVVEYNTNQGGGYTVERLMPTPFKLSMKCDIWTSSADQKLQLLEQILVLFNPSLEIQTTDNYIDWTSLSVLDLKNITMSSRSIPQGTETEIDVCTLEFQMPIYLTPPAKVKKLGIVKTIINNVFTEQGDIVDLENLVYNRRKGTFDTTTNRYRVLLFKSNNGEPYDYDLTLVNPEAAVLAMGLDQRDYKNGEPVTWNELLEVVGGQEPGSRVYFKQASGYEMVGTYAVNPTEPTTLVVTFDRDTVPQNSIIDSVVPGMPSRGTVDAIIDPQKYNPVEVFGSQANITLGIRFLMLDDINPKNANVDGPDGWKNLDGSDPVIKANSMIEWNGSAWVSVWDPDTGEIPTYIQNLRTGIKYRWDGTSWFKAFEGEYAPGYWNLIPPA